MSLDYFAKTCSLLFIYLFYIIIYAHRFVPVTPSITDMKF